MSYEQDEALKELDKALDKVNALYPDEDESTKITTPYSELDVFIAACGNDEFGNSKASVAIKVSGVDVVKGEEVDELDEIVLDEPIVNICKSYKFTMVDLTFNPKSFDFVNAVARLQDFTKIEQLARGPENIVPSVILTVSPKSMIGEVYCTGMFGAWCLMPSQVGRAIDTIRFTFENDYFGTFFVDLNSAFEEAGLNENM